MKFLCSHCGITGESVQPSACPQCGLKKFVHVANTGRFAFPRHIRDRERNPGVAEPVLPSPADGETPA
jgi:predicted  nucleic acid-binding Zn-ribbon protein